MRVLLDTNIIIHRENKVISNKSIGHLFYWLDKLQCTKLIHPFSINEISKYNDSQVQSLYEVKLDAYERLQTVAPQSKEFQDRLAFAPITSNDVIDNQLLYELYSERVDILITEDRKMRVKATALGLSTKVFSINSFISLQTSRYPNLISYKTLSVFKERFGNIDIRSKFFDTFRLDYDGFEKWFAKKCDEEAYICMDDSLNLQGFLYLKVENETENYTDIQPLFAPLKRLKVGTFKVESTGFRLGERFLKIIFDNAVQYRVDEIYVTLFEDREELQALQALLYRWGFKHYGIKRSNCKNEIVLTKSMHCYDANLSPKENFPNVNYETAKYILPIYPQYHTRLLPDSILNTEDAFDFLDKSAEKYALEKIYLSLTQNRNMKKGDILFIYRIGETEPKSYSSVISTLAILSDIKYGFTTKEDFLNTCKDRTVFTNEELERFWRQKGQQWVLVKFIPICSLSKRPILKQLRDCGIIEWNKGPRPFHSLGANEYNKIIELSNTNVY